MQVPAIDQELLIIIAAVVLLIVVAVVVFAVVRSRRRRQEHERLRDRFGAEYEHAVDTEGSRKAAEDLHGRVAERESFTPADPGDATREDLRRRMATLQYRFVEDPADVLLETQRVLIDGLRACGYPIAEDREHALRLLSVDYPDITPSLRTLFEGSYGSDAGRMQRLFRDARAALRDVVRVTYSTDDLPAGAVTGPKTALDTDSGRPQTLQGTLRDQAERPDEDQADHGRTGDGTAARRPARPATPAERADEPAEPRTATPAEPRTGTPAEPRTGESADTPPAPAEGAHDPGTREPQRAGTSRRPRHHDPSED